MNGSQLKVLVKIAKHDICMCTCLCIGVWTYFDMFMRTFCRYVDIHLVGKKLICRSVEMNRNQYKSHSSMLCMLIFLTNLGEKRKATYKSIKILMKNRKLFRVTEFIFCNNNHFNRISSFPKHCFYEESGENNPDCYPS